MPKKIKEREEELDIKKVDEQKKKPTFAQKWFADHAVNNKAELKMVCDLTARAIEEQFGIRVDSGHTEVYASIFHGVFMSVLNFIRQKQRAYNKFTITFYQSVNLGFVNSEDNGTEKVGNFMPVMEHIGINRTIINRNDYSDYTGYDDPDKAPSKIRIERSLKERLAEWNELNIREAVLNWQVTNAKKNVEYYNEIQEDAYNRLKAEYHVSLRVAECALPMFCIFLDMMVGMLKMKFKEAEGTDVSEVSMNVLGLFDVFYSFNEEDNQEIIEFQPNITMKLALKQDEIASRE